MTDLKIMAARAAVTYLDSHMEDNTILGIGTGSTVNYFIEALTTLKHRIDGCVASSKKTEVALRNAGFPLLDLNTTAHIPFYIDGADEMNDRCEMIKGGGGALTREKIIATVAHRFIGIIDQSKFVNNLGTFPVAVEVISIARSFVARELVKLGGNPEYREGFITDNGNILLDVFNLDLTALMVMEEKINQIPGVVENGIFAKRRANLVFMATNKGVTILT